MSKAYKNSTLQTRHPPLLSHIYGTRESAKSSVKKKLNTEKTGFAGDITTRRYLLISDSAF